MRTQQAARVHIVRVGDEPPWVVRRDEDAVKVLVHAHDRAEVVEHRKDRVADAVRVVRVEVALDTLPDQVQRMASLVVEVTTDLRDDSRRDVRPIVGRVGLTLD